MFELIVGFSFFKTFVHLHINHISACLGSSDALNMASTSVPQRRPTLTRSYVLDCPGTATGLTYTHRYRGLVGLANLVFGMLNRGPPHDLIGHHVVHGNFTPVFPKEGLAVARELGRSVGVAPLVEEPMDLDAAHQPLELEGEEARVVAVRL